MPIELGIALGMKYVGRKSIRDHMLLVLDTERFRYQKFASDLSGVDPAAHGNKPQQAIEKVRNFLAGGTDRVLPTATPITAAYRTFERELPEMARSEQQETAELTYVDRLRHIGEFIARIDTR